MLSPCSVSLPLAGLQLPTFVYYISLHERRRHSGVSTPVLADDDSTGRHFNSDSTES